jgi:predicted Zn-ribbon and HTH transcriptional regulator
MVDAGFGFFLLRGHQRMFTTLTKATATNTVCKTSGVTMTFDPCQNGSRPPKTLAASHTSAATKATQASPATGTEFMAETSLKSLKAILETIRARADFALKQLQKSEEERSMRWKCKDCNYIKHFTRPVPSDVASPCPQCKSDAFESC